MKAGLNRQTFFDGVKIVAKYLTPFKNTLIILTLFGLINAVSQALVPLIAGRIFDAIIGIAKNSFTPLGPVFTLIALWTLLQFIANIVGWWTNSENDRLATFLQADYTANSYGKLLELPFAFHATQKQGNVSDRINRASNWLESIVDRILLTLFPNFLSIIVAIIIASFIKWQLTLVLVAAILIYVMILWVSVPQIGGLQRKMNRAYNRAYGDAYDILGNIREVKQAANEGEEKKKIRHNFVVRAAGFWIDMNNIFQRLNLSQRILVTMTQLSIFILSIFFVKNGSMTPGQLVAFNGYAAMILGPFVILGQNWQIVQNGLTSIVRAEKILTLPTENYSPKGAFMPKKLKGEVEFHNVYFSYKASKETLSGISFHALPGQKVALVGESGVGKTTIIDLLIGFYFPQKGMVAVDGVNIKKMDLSKYRSRIGIVPQEPTLFNDTVEKNIRYGNEGISDAKMKTAAREAHAEDFIQSFPKKYKQVVGWRGIKLSVGQKQRIALARAFLRNPDILILDEPTSALDAKSEHLIKLSLRKLMEGRTTFIIAHRLSTVREADLILVFKQGKVVEQGKHNDLIKIPKGIYRSLYELQMGFSAE